MIRWECPNCVATHGTADPRPHTPMHQCAGLRGLMAPLVRVPPQRVELPRGVRVVAVERGDYVAGERVQADGEGRPVMAVRTERADGSNDVHILAPTASATAHGGE